MDLNKKKEEKKADELFGGDQEDAGMGPSPRSAAGPALLEASAEDGATHNIFSSDRSNGDAQKYGTKPAAILEYVRRVLSDEDEEFCDTDDEINEDIVIESGGTDGDLKEKKKENRFTTISSQFSKKILKEKLDSKDIGKFIVYLSNDKVYLKSDAVLQIFIEIGGIYKLFTLLKIFPSGFRNIFYDFFASKRYKWFGKLDECHLPSKEIADRFYL